MDGMLYQINPHFLYNTLDNMFMLARINGDERMGKLIQELSYKLRISLNKGAEYVTVRQELAHARAYLDIQKIRYGPLFDYTVFCGDDAGDCLITKLILQPIVKNCIKYGFSGMAAGGRIDIRAEREGGHIALTVKNNGAPISGDAAEKLNAMKDMEIQDMRTLFDSPKGGFGLYNVVSRLKLRYGKDFELRYEALEEGGTRCALLIPIRDEAG